MTAKQLWGAIIVVVSVVFFIYGSMQLYDVLQAENHFNQIGSGLGAEAQNAVKSLIGGLSGVDVGKEFLKKKIGYGVLMGACVAGAFIGTQLFRKKKPLA